ncbi:MAG TPA: dihydrofolate reductase family protein [Pseudolabrys sp.]|nr:dihydrofolate reductase family protein [Pseudolabrys sp.]
MSRVVIEMSVSLDGFIAGPDDTPANPFGGNDARRLHDWFVSGSEPYPRNAFFRPQGANRDVIDALFENTGALLTGRRTYDLVGGWGGSHPMAGLPVVVLTHRTSTRAPKGQSHFTFCDDIAGAVAAAKRAAGSKDVMVHGAATTQQLLAAGLVDELSLHVAPILLGAGRPLFASGAPILLEPLQVIATPQVTHLRYRVGKRPD